MKLNYFNEKHINEIDGLKGLGACIVAFLWHYQHFKPEFSPFYKLMPVAYDYGWAMVELFFMLSGFGMMAGYSDKILNRETTFKAFLLKRIKKIYPIFLFSIVLTIFFNSLYMLITNGQNFIYDNFDLDHLFW